MSRIKITMVIAAATMAGVTACGAQAPSPAPAGTRTTSAAAASVTRSPSAAVIAARLKAAGQPVRALITYTAVTDPNHLLGRQGEYTSKVAWQDPRALAAGAGSPSSDPGGIEYGGGIEVFPTVAAAAQRLAYLKSFKPPFGDGYDYQSGTAILRLSNYLTPAQARAYAAAFMAAVG
jgi:hypothetical protein